jgi:RHS repeat-associated protein
MREARLPHRRWPRHTRYTDSVTGVPKNGFQTITSAYVLGPGGEQLTETDGSGNWQHTNVYAAGAMVATYDAHPSSTSNPNPLHFQLADWLGTRRVQTDINGVIEENCSSLAFGDTLNGAPICGQPQGAPATADDATEHHFTGKERDTESGNDYFGARYYSSAMGRWMSPDWSSSPAAVPYANLDNPQSLNLYLYAGNNPLIHVDADGHCWPQWLCNAGQALKNGLTNHGFVTNQTRKERTEARRQYLEQHGVIGVQNHNGDQLPTYIDNWQTASEGTVDHFYEMSQDPKTGIDAATAAAALTTPAATQLAKSLGFNRVKVGWDTHGQAVYEKDGRYISPDKDSHSGGVWKEFDRQGNRTGTLDAMLNRIGK